MNFSNDQTSSTASTWAARGLGALVAAAFFGSGVAKLGHVPRMVEGLTHAGIPLAAIVPIGILELFLVALYVLPRTSVLGTFLLTGFVGGAIVTHIIGRESFAPPLILGVLMLAGSISGIPNFARSSRSVTRQQWTRSNDPIATGSCVARFIPTHRE